ncbi:MAG: PQQ-dependent sugar dehydrogenase [Chitinophagales bacterium]
MKLHYFYGYAIFFCLAFFCQNTYAQCDGDEVEVEINIVEDDYPQETSWTLTYADGMPIANGNVNGQTVCVFAETCLTFTIYDSANDGLCCGYGLGSYTVLIDGNVQAEGGEFGGEESVSINCATGTNCNVGETVEEGSFTAAQNDVWYVFTPAETGTYQINACDNECSTAVWVYDFCSGLEWDDTPNFSLAFDNESCDNGGGTAFANLAANTTYYIRIGSTENECENPINWTLSYEGEVSGCIDPAACTYEPLATIDDPTACFYFPAEECLAFANSVTIGGTTLIERDVAIDLQVPWEIIWGPDNHIWATERIGRVQRIEPMTGNQTIILDIQTNVASGGEPGMLGMVLHPDFETTPLVYIAYNFASGFNIAERLSSFEWNGEMLVNEAILIDDIPGGNIHDGSRLLITPDYKILMTMGDRGNQNLAQDTDNFNGKILRINLDGSVPDDNPIAGQYTYTYGHRNPQGLTYGPNNILYSTEHGASTSDELNLIEEGRNYGWPNVEGACDTGSEMNFCNNNDVREPLAEWSPCPAVNDIIYYNHPAIPEFQHSLLMAVLGGLGGGYERISHLPLNEDGTEVIGENQYFTNFGRLRDICINPITGAIYFATNGGSYPGSGPNRIVEYRNYEYIVLGTEPTVAIAENQQFIQIYPNPARSQTQIVFAESFVGHTFYLYNYSGQLVKERKITNVNMTLHTQDLPKTAYFVKASSDLGTITKKLMVQ